MISRAVLALAAASLAACQDETGTIALDLVTAPGSTVLDAVTLLRVKLTRPPAVFDVPRTSTGFDLAFEVEATDESGALIIEGYDASGALVATGMSPPFQVGGINARIAIYVAYPLSIAPAPIALTPARELVSIAPLPYGAVLAGGRDLATGAGAASDALAIYNAFDHSLVGGLPMPAPRVGIALGTSGTGSVYMFGGASDDGAPTGTVWRFETAVAPSGAYVEIADQAGFARTGEALVAIDTNHFLATGAPVVELAGADLRPRIEVPALGPGGASILRRDGSRTAVFADAAGITRYQDGAFTNLSAVPRQGARTVALPDGTALVVGDASAEAVRVDPASGQLTTLAGFLPADCTAVSLAATTRHLLLSCTAQTYVYDPATLELVIAIDRTGTALTPLPNDQVLMLGPAGDLQLFTPGPPG